MNIDAAVTSRAGATKPVITWVLPDVQVAGAEPAARRHRLPEQRVKGSELPGGWVLPEDLPRLAPSRRQPCRHVRDRGTWTVPPPRIEQPVRLIPIEPSATAERIVAERRLPRKQAEPLPTASRVAATIVATESIPETLRAKRNLRRPLLIGVAAAAALVITAGEAAVGETTQAVTVTIDGAPQFISTNATTVGEALASVGITVGEHDIVAPSPHTKVTASSAISIRRGRLVTVSVDGKKRKVWTTATTVEAALAQLGIDSGDYQLSAARHRPIGLDGLTFTGKRLHSITVTDGSGRTDKLRTTASRVADVLAAQGIRLGKLDRVSPAMDQVVTDGQQIAVTRVVITLAQKIVPVAQPKALVHNDPAVGKGNTVVSVKGRDGKRAIVKQTTVVNGVPTTKVLSDEVTTPAVGQVTSIGTKETGRKESWSVPWDKMAFCESTSRWDVNTGNGTYGGLQFMTPTWLAYGGGEFAERADLATMAEQIIVAERLYAKEGLAPWHCARLLGWGFGKYTG